MRLGSVLLLVSWVASGQARASDAPAQGAAPAAGAHEEAAAPMEPAESAWALGRALADVRPGRVLRVSFLPAETLEAPYQGLGAGALHLGEQPPGEAVPVERVQTVAVRGRATGTGATVGAIVVGLLGVGLGVAFQGFCLGADNGGDSCLGVIPLLGGLGVGAGGLLGAVVGAAFPRWQQRYARPAAALAVPAPPAPRETSRSSVAPGVGHPVGSIGVRAAYTRSAFTAGLRDPVGRSPTVENPGQPGLQLQLLAHLLPQFALGPEVGWYRDGSFHLGGAVRGGLRLGRFHPFVQATAGLHSPGDGQGSFLAASLGGGLRWLPGLGPLFLEVEARGQRSLGGLEGHMDLATVSAGAGAQW